jgi:hypothetical protein
MSARSTLVSLDGNANGRQTDHVRGSTGSRLRAGEARRQMAEMERVFSAPENHTGQMDALATLRRWQVDARLDEASRDRASALVWKFQANGWDEV